MHVANIAGFRSTTPDFSDTSSQSVKETIKEPIVAYRRLRNSIMANVSKNVMTVKRIMMADAIELT